MSGPLAFSADETEGAGETESADEAERNGIVEFAGLEPKNPFAKGEDFTGPG